MNSDLLYRQLVAFICFVPFLAQTFGKTFIVADYYAHKNRYTRNCENRQRPIVRCYGRCQLAKKLQQEEKKQQQNPAGKAVAKNEPVFFTGYTVNTVSVIRPGGNIKQNIPLSEGSSIELSYDIFHPPKI